MLVWICRFPLPLGVWEGLRFVIVALPGLFSYLFYSWERPVILVAGKVVGKCFHFFCFCTFIPVPFSSLSLSFISSTVSSIYFLPFSGRRLKNLYKRVDVSLNPNTINLFFVGSCGHKTPQITNWLCWDFVHVLPVCSLVLLCLVGMSCNVIDSLGKRELFFFFTFLVCVLSVMVCMLFILCLFFYFTALLRIFHLYRTGRSSKVGKNRRTRRKPLDHP